jgi:hypothetical protein
LNLCGLGNSIKHVCPVTFDVAILAIREDKSALLLEIGFERPVLQRSICQKKRVRVQKSKLNPYYD